MTQYTCHLADDKPIESMTYTVKRMGEPNSNLDMTQREVREQTLRAVDNGFGEYIGLNEYLPHQTTLIACSCQFPDCYGLPCRHIIRRAFEQLSSQNASVNNQQDVVEKILVSQKSIYAVCLSPK
jgi:hypothetical protein